MRILIFNELYTPYKSGGAEVSTQLLAESLCSLGHDVHVCTSCDHEYDEVINGVSIHRKLQHNIYWSYKNKEVTNLQKLYWHLKESYNIGNRATITDLVEQIHPDVIHTNVFTGFSAIIWQIANRKHIPIVHTLRDYYLMCVRSTMFNHGKECLSQCRPCKLISVPKKTMSKYVDGVVGISQYILHQHIRQGYFKKSKIQEVIPNAVSFPDVVEIGQREKAIGYLGRIHPSKGIEYLINAFLKSDGVQQYVLKIAGDGNPDYLKELKNKYESDKIQFLGRVDATTFLRSIEVLVVPSFWQEPFGRVIIEANGCGCPVLVSNRGGMPELVNESNGRVFSLEKPDSLCQLLNTYFSGKLSFNLSFFDRNRYMSENIAKQYLSIYGKLL